MLQTLPPVDAGPSWQMIALGAVGLVQVLAIHVGRGVQRDIRAQGERIDATHETVVKIDTALFGVQGDNGINGDVKELKRKEEARTRAEADRQHKETNRRGAILTRLLRLEEHNGLEPMHPRGSDA